MFQSVGYCYQRGKREREEFHNIDHIRSQNFYFSEVRV